MAKKLKAVTVPEEPTYDDKNNPSWRHGGDVTVTRMDNSIAMEMGVGEIRIGNDVYELGVPLGGAGVFLLYGSNRYSIDCRELIKSIIKRESEFKRAPRRKLERRK